MALSSAEIMTQIQGMSKMPDYRTQVAEAYDAPVLRPLVQEGSNLEGQYLSSVFDPFTRMGTGAGDMSPAAKLSALGSSMGRLGGRIGANQSMQNYYGAQIGDIVNRLSNDWQTELSNKWQMYNAAAQREAQERALAAQRAAQIDWSRYLTGAQQGGVGQGAGGARAGVTNIDELIRRIQQPMGQLGQGIEQTLGRNPLGQGIVNVAKTLGPGLARIALPQTGLTGLLANQALGFMPAPPKQATPVSPTQTQIANILRAYN